MAVLVTGATDIVGANLVRSLLRKKEPVRVLLQNNDRNNVILKGLDVEREYGDIRDLNSLRRTLNGCTTVYHTEELNPFGYCRPDAYFVSNLEGTRNVFQAAHERGVKRVMYMSSAYTIGCGTAETPADEDAEFNLGHLKDPYITSKLQAEQLARDYLKKGLEIVILNPGLLLGAFSIRPSIGRTLLQISGIMTRFLPGGSILISDAEDVALASQCLMEHGTPGERCIVGSKNVRYSVLLDLVDSVVGMTPFSFLVPRYLAMIAGRISDTLARTSGKGVPFVPSSSVVKRTYEDLFVTSEKATLRWGISWTPVRKTLTKNVQWLREYELM